VAGAGLQHVRRWSDWNVLTEREWDRKGRCREGLHCRQLVRHCNVSKGRAHGTGGWGWIAIPAEVVGLECADGAGMGLEGALQRGIAFSSAGQALQCE
jgi:hypothetical protein